MCQIGVEWGLGVEESRGVSRQRNSVRILGGRFVSMHEPSQVLSDFLFRSFFSPSQNTMDWFYLAGASGAAMLAGLGGSGGREDTLPKVLNAVLEAMKKDLKGAFRVLRGVITARDAKNAVSGAMSSM